MGRHPNGLRGDPQLNRQEFLAEYGEVLKEATQEGVAETIFELVGEAMAYAILSVDPDKIFPSVEEWSGDAVDVRYRDAAIAMFRCEEFVRMNLGLTPIEELAAELAGDSEAVPE